MPKQCGGCHSELRPIPGGGWVCPQCDGPAAAMIAKKS